MPESSGPPSKLADEASAPDRIRSLLQGRSLFDPEYYLARYPDIAAAGIDPLDHYTTQGYKEDRSPNAWFDAVWYRSSYMAGAGDAEIPLVHYATAGDLEGNRPSALFDTEWYRSTYRLEDGQTALEHYLQNRRSGASPLPEFDAKFYLSRYPDVAAAGVDPFEHFWQFGFSEGRDPSPTFSTRYYVSRYMKGREDENPLKHFLESRHLLELRTRPSESDVSVPNEIKRFTRPSASFEEFRPSTITRSDVLLLAYYLTQFHAFPENDRWWGKGFTEWTNIPRGVPRFEGHYQPRIPRDLGYYTLTDPEVMRTQIRLAKAAGIGAFCFYYYWFNRQRLMERPLENFLSDQSLDMPFCLMWANENWTRRWDGMESEVLISQDYSADDEEPFVADLARHFRDPRYVRLGGRPLFFIYRPGIIPDCRNTLARWRLLFDEKHGEAPIFVMAQAFGDNDPRDYDFDGAIEFPPHKLTSIVQPREAGLHILDDSFEGRVYDYDDVVRASLEEPMGEFPLIKTVVPSWDNDARRQGTGLVLQGSTPDKYESWLSAVLGKARSSPFHGTPIACVNAWNEWCEGAYLEPDLHFGAAYLNATSRAITGRGVASAHPRILLVGHDAFPSGAQQLLVHIGATLRQSLGVEIEFMLLGGGAMLERYEGIAPTKVCTTRNEQILRIEELAKRGFGAAICNTSVTGQVCALLAERGFTVNLLVHELPGILVEKGLTAKARAGLESATNVIFPSAFVRDRTVQAVEVAGARNLLVRPQGSYKELEPSEAGAKAALRLLGIPPGHRMVLGVGYADLRKGFDLFLQVWRLTHARSGTIHFCWLGDIDPTLRAWLKPETDAAMATGTFHMPGHQPDVGGFYAAASAFALTSREDPFPTVALEAMSAGVPVVAFRDTGGIPDLLESEGIGHVVPVGDVIAMADTLRNVALGLMPSRLSGPAVEHLRARFDFRAYVRFLAGLALPQYRQVSAVVPNYNYERYLPERLGSIFDQAYLVSEVLMLDDASSDKSVDVALEVARKAGREFTLHVREENSGSVFAQWRYAAEVAQGEFLWIAEADDAADPSLLARLVAAMTHDGTIAFAFCDSRSVDAAGTPMYSDYKGYYDQIEPGALAQDALFEGAAFVERLLAERNVILNASAVVWRRQALLDALERAGDDVTAFTMAGDWRLYLEALVPRGAKVAYVAEPLNVHRRHGGSVTHRLAVPAHLDEIGRIHAFARSRFRLSPSARERQRRYLEELRREMTVSN